MTISRFSFPTTIHFGPGARRLVADHLKAQRVQRPLIVTDRGIAPLPLLAEFRRDADRSRRGGLFRDLGQSGTKPGECRRVACTRRIAPMR